MNSTICYFIKKLRSLFTDSNQNERNGLNPNCDDKECKDDSWEEIESKLYRDGDILSQFAEENEGPDQNSDQGK